MCLEEAEAEVGTDDEWTLVQCKYKSPKVGLDLRSKGVHDDKVNDVREQNRFMKVNKTVKWNNNNGNILKESDHERDRNHICKPERERITIELNRNG